RDDGGSPSSAIKSVRFKLDKETESPANAKCPSDRGTKRLRQGQDGDDDENGGKVAAATAAVRDAEEGDVLMSEQAAATDGETTASSTMAMHKTPPSRAQQRAKAD
ncbi:unnamed protein product, partial [Ectocarpus sp. 12 AP-2014]